MSNLKILGVIKYITPLWLKEYIYMKPRHYQTCQPSMKGVYIIINSGLDNAISLG